MSGFTYIFLAHTLDSGAPLADERLDHCTERHRIDLVLPKFAPMPAPLAEVERLGAQGLVLCLEAGWPGLFHMRLMRRALARGLRVLACWPAEGAVEVVDNIRLKSFRLHWWAIKFFQVLYLAGRIAVKGRALLGRFFTILKYLFFDLPKVIVRTPRHVLAAKSSGLRRGYLVLRGLVQANDESVPPILRQIADELDAILDLTFHRPDPRVHDVERLFPTLTPTGLAAFSTPPSPTNPLGGAGLYLRTDFWSPLTSGGSYGHTCHVARELARRCQDFLCLTACRYPLLEAIGLRQLTPEPPGEHGNEYNIVHANQHYEPQFRTVFQALAPAFVYERICLGNCLGAKLCAEFRIPYVVEYNGSEISMKRSFSGESYQHEAYYLAAEEAAFRQADAVHVVSKWVKKDVVARGVDPDKVLVNPNGVDTATYRPAPAEARRALRAEFGWDDSHVVVGFTGTFGGWHGVDVLAQAMPRICERLPGIRFLLIGDGNYMPLVRQAVGDKGLHHRVALPGRVPQEEGARLLGACDLLVSPHSSHMVDSPFFGSPTKIFEYMAMGAGIVASDLEQIGEVLSPALRVEDLVGKEPVVTNQRAVLVSPGAVDEFVDAVSSLAQQPAVAAALGANARRAAEDVYSWDRHVDRLFRFLAGENAAALAAEAGVNDYTPEEDTCPEPEADVTAPERLETGDAYKDQAQAQWDQDPCGSHYVKLARKKTLEWFQEAEEYRYGTYAPWMPEVMEFAGHAGEKVLEIGGGMGTDLAQFARNGALVTDYDLSQGHLALARENFARRGLDGEFLHGDAERLPFPDNTFDVVYSNGVIHHIPHTQQVIDEMFRVLKPGGKAIVMVYAEHSKHYWKNLVFDEGIAKGLLYTRSMGDIMSEVVEISAHGQRPLVKVYTAGGLRGMFGRFTGVKVLKRQMVAEEKPGWAAWMSLERAGRLMGWNLVIKASKPREAGG